MKQTGFSPYIFGSQHPGLQPLRECNLGQTSQARDHPTMNGDRLFAELWISLASLLSSYTAAHGLSAASRASVELDEDKITVRHGRKWLRLVRDGASVAWTRENGIGGTLELTAHGRLRGPAGEQELDMAAEAWARELLI